MSGSEHTLSDIAIVGMSARFPGAKNIDEFWLNLKKGVESVIPLSDQDLKTAIDSLNYQDVPYITRNMKDPSYVRAGAVLGDTELFDAGFFDFNPSEAELLDPQKRILLECSWEALENAGYDPETFPGLIGMYAGSALSEYYTYNLILQRDILHSERDLQLALGNEHDYLTTYVSYKLNLKGPSINLQSACSTSLVDIHLACQSIVCFESDMALAGGVVITVPEKLGYLYREGSMLSPDGHVRAFDAKAQGTVFSRGGVGVVVLKRLTDAIKDGDHIYAVIKGSAVNNDGSVKIGYTAPGLEGQVALVSEALSVTDIDPGTISYIEAHGTGTPLGDPIEITALTQAFQQHTQKKGFCAIGSVKTNIGHLSVTAGVAGLIKTALALKHKQIPPSLNFKEPNPKIDFENSPFYVITQLKEWDTDSLPRRAGVSSFGMGGTNAHAILEEAPHIEPSVKGRAWQLLTLSAKTETALDAMRKNLASHLKSNPDLNLADVAYTLQVGRKVFGHRSILVCRNNIEEAVCALEGKDSGRKFNQFQSSKDRSVVFMFTGQGSQYVNMGLELYQSEKEFREQVDTCSQILKPHLGLDLRDIIYPGDKDPEKAGEQLKQTMFTQPALFVIEYALAKLWNKWGIKPQAMIGHSIGEYVAATLAGVLRLDDALELVALRGRMMQSLPSGSMLAVRMTEEELRPLLEKDISIAAINAPSLCVASGRTESIAQLEKKLTDKGIGATRLHTSHAFHSEMMDPIMESFTEKVKSFTLNPPVIPYISNVTGTWVRPEEATDPTYWARHLRNAVRFSDGVDRLLKETDSILLEVGPGTTLCTLAKMQAGKDSDRAVLPSIRSPQGRDIDTAFLMSTLGRLWLAGASINWSGFYKTERRLRIPLPTYPFQRKRYWKKQEKPKEYMAANALAGRLPDLADWFYIPSWKRSLPPTPFEAGNLADHKSCWLIFTDTSELGTSITANLRQDGQDVVTVRLGSQFAKLDALTYTIDPGDANAYHDLFKDLVAEKRVPATIVHLWSLIPTQHGDEKAEILAFYSMLFLVQAIGKQGIESRLQIIAVTDSLHEVTGTEVLCPDKATILGPCMVIDKEYPNITTRNVDILLSKANVNQLACQLIAEFTVSSSDLVTAYRGVNRWVQTYEPSRLEKDTKGKILLRQGGVYLITGGFGGIGLEAAKYLAKNMQAGLILTGRSAIPEPQEWEEWLKSHDRNDSVSQKIRKVQELERSGAKVLALSADVTNQEQMHAVIEQANHKFGKINGVIHSAGLPGGGMIQLKDPKVASNIISPKVKGTLILEKLFKDVPLDFMVLCSSLYSVAGGIGQIDYCAGNAFLDAFAHYNTSQNGIPTISINWDSWLEVGMAVDTGAVPKRTPHIEERIIHPLIHKCIEETTDQIVYSTRFSVPEHWILDEHRIMGNPVIPGVGYLEMIWAGIKHDKDMSVEMEDIFFMAPISVAENEIKEVRTVLRKDGEVFEATVLSGFDGRKASQTHANGKVKTVKLEPAKKYQIEDILKSCNRGEEVIDKDHPLREDPFISFGPRWQTLKKIYLGFNEALAFLELPEAFSDDLANFYLHPSLLDTATAFLTAFLVENILFAGGKPDPDEDIPYLPLSYKSIKIKGPLPREIYSYVKLNENLTERKKKEPLDIVTCNIVIMDKYGVELLNIEGFSMKRVRDADGVSHTLSEPVSTLTPESDLDLGLLPQEGIDAFLRILSRRSISQIAVSIKDLNAFLKKNIQSNETVKEEEDVTESRESHPRPDVSTPYVPPVNELEKTLVDTWQSGLGIEKVGIHDNFFELGGDSLLAIQIISKAKRAGLAIAPNQLFQYQTIAQLAAVVSKGKKESEEALEKPPTKPATEFSETGLGREEIEKFISKITDGEGKDKK